MKSSRCCWSLSLLLVAAYLPSAAQSFLVRKSHYATIAVFPSSTTSPTSLDLFRSKSASQIENPNVIEIESHVDWMEMLHDENDADITAVTFHASWCKFCQKFKLKWNRKIVRPFSTEVKFASVEFGANKKLCQSLNIKQLPTVQFYTRNGNLVSSFPCGPKSFGVVQKTMNRYLEMDLEQLEREAALWEARVQHSSSGGGENTDIPIALEEAEGESSDVDAPDDEEEEPELYLRKRDRFKKKLSRKKDVVS
uniref:Thioredoxin domain-containing protein n=1 Tax=Ditylum brightwellii TaxID=49249 RepID=A0A7S4V5T1_9STRA|mmetsp:Transcript_7726/g.10234  ORF Transcript_7726/g.10234 Transcript_7726/m.10234 type:complete len:252 (+) Transcript_7726:156-911(+)